MSNRLIIAIGASGSGKSTLFNTIAEQSPNVQCFSFDRLRHEWYDPVDYANAFALACQDKSFDFRSKQVFDELIVGKYDVFVDNVNATPKSRKWFIDRAKRSGYTIEAYNLHVPLNTLLSRQHTRGDKCVPGDAVKRQYQSLVYGVVGTEFDKVTEVYTP